MSQTLPAGRLVALAALAVALSVPAQAQERLDAPSLRSTYVVPSLRGETVRVTTYAQRPSERGRLARQYRGLRVDRPLRVQTRSAVGALRYEHAQGHRAQGVRLSHARLVAPTLRTARGGTFVRRNGTHFPVRRHP